MGGEGGCPAVCYVPCNVALRWAAAKQAGAGARRSLPAPESIPCLQACPAACTARRPTRRSRHLGGPEKVSLVRRRREKAEAVAEAPAAEVGAAACMERHVQALSCDQGGAQAALQGAATAAAAAPTARAKASTSQQCAPHRLRIQRGLGLLSRLWALALLGSLLLSLPGCCCCVAALLGATLLNPLLVGSSTGTGRLLAGSAIVLLLISSSITGALLTAAAAACASFGSALRPVPRSSLQFCAAAGSRHGC